MAEEKLVGVGVALRGAGGPSANMNQKLLSYNFDPGCLRPWKNKDGKCFITVKNCLKKTKADPDFINVPVANATLTYDEWKEVDQSVQAAARIRTPVAGLLRSRGLTKTFNGFGRSTFKYQRRKEKTGATRSMDGLTAGNQNGVLYDDVDVPLYLDHDAFWLGSRHLNISRQVGDSLDTEHIEESTANITEAVEAQLCSNITLVYGGGTVYSLVNHPNRNTVTLSQNWDASGKTGEEILDDVLDMKQASINDRNFGPWALIVPTGYETPLEQDFKANSDLSVRERLQKVDKIEAVVVADKLPANTVVLVQLDQRTIKMLDGLPMTVLEWETVGGLQINWKLMTIQVPLIRADYAGNIGLVVLS